MPPFHSNVEPVTAPLSEEGTYRVGNLSDFSQSLFQTAVERPFNGVAELIDLPELRLTGDYYKNSFAAQAGTVAGTVLDFALLSKGYDAAAGKYATAITMKSGVDYPRSFQSVSLGLKMMTLGGVDGGVFTKGSFNDRIFSGAEEAKNLGVCGYLMPMVASGIGKVALKVKPESASGLKSQMEFVHRVSPIGLPIGNLVFSKEKSPEMTKGAGSS